MVRKGKLLSYTDTKRESLMTQRILRKGGIKFTVKKEFGGYAVRKSDKMQPIRKKPSKSFGFNLKKKLFWVTLLHTNNPF